MKKNNRGANYFFILVVIVAFVIAAFFITTLFTSCDTKSKQVTAGECLDDSVITTTVKSLLGSDNFLKSFQVGVETRKGIVQLSGFVNTQKAADKAGKIVQGVKGVKSVQNDLIVK